MRIYGEGLKGSFGGKTVFENVSFEIEENSFVGLYGRSGAGKSTLAKMLCGICLPDEGSIYADGAVLASKTGYDRRRGIRIQMVYQQPWSSLDPGQRLISGFYELIGYHKFAPSKNAADELISSLMAEVGLDPGILNHLPYQISGGEAQRIAIAKCLLFRPELLILDEATAMLDVSTQANVFALIGRLMKKNGGSVLLISHDSGLVHHLCGRIYVMENGTVHLER